MQKVRKVLCGRYSDCKCKNGWQSMQLARHDVELTIGVRSEIVRGAFGLTNKMGIVSLRSSIAVTSQNRVLEGDLIVAPDHPGFLNTAELPEMERQRQIRTVTLSMKGVFGERRKLCVQQVCRVLCFFHIHVSTKSWCLQDVVEMMSKAVLRWFLKLVRRKTARTPTHRLKTTTPRLADDVGQRSTFYALC